MTMYVKVGMYLATEIYMSWLRLTFHILVPFEDSGINAADVPELVVFMQIPCSAVGL